MRMLMARLRVLPERLRFKYYPRFADVRLRHATRKARDRLKDHPLSVLVDNTILDLAVTHETGWISTGRGTGHAARIPVHAPGNSSPRYREITFLTGLAYLARSGLLSLYQSAELEDERFRQPAGRYTGYGYFDYSLLKGIPMPSIDGDVEHVMGPKWMQLPSVEVQQRRRLSENPDPLFKSLFALLSEQQGKKCSQDAAHIATAEHHGLQCFLTTDRKLLATCKSLAHKEPLCSMKTAVMSPSELAMQLGIKPVPPHILSYNEASWFVSTDRTMPNERRRKVGEYGR